MPQMGIHPGEHLAEELRALNMSAAEMARESQCADHPDHRDFEWTARH